MSTIHADRDQEQLAPGSLVACAWGLRSLQIDGTTLLHIADIYSLDPWFRFCHLQHLHLDRLSDWSDSSTKVEAFLAGLKGIRSLSVSLFTYTDSLSGSDMATLLSIDSTELRCLNLEVRGGLEHEILDSRQLTDLLNHFGPVVVLKLRIKMEVEWAKVLPDWTMHLSLGLSASGIRQLLDLLALSSRLPGLRSLSLEKCGEGTAVIMQSVVDRAIAGLHGRGTIKDIDKTSNYLYRLVNSQVG